MKKIIYHVMALALTLSLSACFDDDSSLGSGTVGDITITGMEDSYANIAYMGETLDITPDVKTDEATTYEWLLLDGKTGSKDDKGDEIQPTVIGTDKDLHYAVNLAPGTYQLRLVAKGQSGYTVYKTASFTVRTTFSQGFYILKENAEGNTDVDLYTLDGKQGSNLIATVDGQALPGKPLAIAPLYETGYINPDDDEMASANTICVMTDQGGMRVGRTTDFKQILSRDNIMFGEMDADEKVCGFFGGMFYNCMVTTKGLYEASRGDGTTTGKYGMPVSECGGSRFYLTDLAAMSGGALWDEKSHSLEAFNYNFVASPLVKTDQSGEELTQNLASYECLYCGYNLMNRAGRGTFVLKDNATSQRYLYVTAGSFMSGTSLLSRTQLSAGSHMANASYYACCGLSASYIYCVDGGKLYACNFKSDNLAEVELRPTGIADGETINFVANQFWNSSSDDFDYLIVGTQKGNTYKLYFYKTNGGAPIDAPIHVTEGQGKVKCVRFVNDSFNSSSIMMQTLTYNNND